MAKKSSKTKSKAEPVTSGVASKDALRKIEKFWNGGEKKKAAALAMTLDEKALATAAPGLPGIYDIINSLPKE